MATTEIQSPFAPPPAPSRTPFRVIGPVILASLAAFIPETVRDTAACWVADREMLAVAAGFDSSFDPILIEGGRVTVLGPRRVDFEDGGNRFLVDPENTVPDEALTGYEQTIVVRAETLIQDRPFQRREYRIQDMQEMLGTDPMRIDSAALRDLWTGRGRALLAILFVIVGGISIALIWLGLLIQAAGLGFILRMAGRTPTMLDGFAVALLASLGPQVTVTLFRYTVWEPGVILRTLLILLLTAPLAWLAAPRWRDDQAS